MKNISTNAARLSYGILACLVVLLLAFGVAGCSSSTSSGSSTDEETETESSSSDTLAAPTDFTLDPETGEYSFTANDENMGYYFIRIIAIVNGEEASTYTVSSTRINGGSTGTITGTMDLSGLGWGEYAVKLISFAAAGTDDVAPDAVVLDLFAGYGGTLEMPEFMVITDGSHVEFIIDWYTQSDWYDYQYMPIVEYNIYSDAECTELVATVTFDMSVYSPSTHPTGAYYWSYTAHGTYDWLVGDEDSYSPDPCGSVDDLEAGTYYVTCQAITSYEDGIASSQVTDPVEIVVTGGDVTDGESYETYTSSGWADPSILGVPVAASGTYTDRTDFGGTQTTTSEIQ